MTAPADSRISDDRLTELLVDLSPNNVMRRKDLDGILSALTELRERRAQAVAVAEPDLWGLLFPGCQKVEPINVFSSRSYALMKSHEFEQKPTVVPLYAAPPPAQAAGVTEALEEAHWDGMDELRRAQVAQAVAWGAPGLSRPLAAVSLERIPGFDIPLFVSLALSQARAVAWQKQHAISKPMLDGEVWSAWEPCSQDEHEHIQRTEQNYDGVWAKSRALSAQDREE